MPTDEFKGVQEVQTHFQIQNAVSEISDIYKFPCLLLAVPTFAIFYCTSLRMRCNKLVAARPHYCIMTINELNLLNAFISVLTLFYFNTAYKI